MRLLPYTESINSYFRPFLDNSNVASVIEESALASIVLDAAPLDSTFHLLALDNHTSAAEVDDALLRIQTAGEVPHGERSTHHTPQRYFRRASDMSMAAARFERVPKAEDLLSGDDVWSHSQQATVSAQLQRWLAPKWEVGTFQTVEVAVWLCSGL